MLPCSSNLYLCHLIPYRRQTLLLCSSTHFHSGWTEIFLCQAMTQMGIQTTLRPCLIQRIQNNKKFKKEKQTAVLKHIMCKNLPGTHERKERLTLFPGFICWTVNAVWLNIRGHVAARQKQQKLRERGQFTCKLWQRTLFSCWEKVQNQRGSCSALLQAIKFYSRHFSFLHFQTSLSSLCSSHPTWQNKADFLLCLTVFCHFSAVIDRISQDQPSLRKSSYICCARSQFLRIHVPVRQWSKSETSAFTEDANFGKQNGEGLPNHRQRPIFQNLFKMSAPRNRDASVFRKGENLKKR